MVLLPGMLLPDKRKYPLGVNAPADATRRNPRG